VFALISLVYIVWKTIRRRYQAAYSGKICTSCRLDVGVGVRVRVRVSGLAVLSHVKAGSVKERAGWS
jgi:hypothetical protein